MIEKTDPLILELEAMQDEFSKTSSKIIKNINRNNKIMQKSDKKQKREHDELLDKISEVENKNKEIIKLLELFDKNIITSSSDLKGNVTYVSNAFTKISQYSKEELMGQPHSMVKHEDTPSSTFEDLWKTIKQKKIWEGEIKNKKKDGSIYWVRVVITPDYTNGVHSGYSAIRYDITDKKEVEEFSNTLESKVKERTQQLKDEQEYVNSVMDAQENILISTDGISLRTANKSFLNFFDIKSIEEFNKNFGSCICDTFYIDESFKYLQKFHKGKKWIDYVTSNPKEEHKAKIISNGKEFIFLVTANEFTYNDSELKVAVFNDITEAEENRIKVDNANRKISTLFNNAKQGFLYFDKDMNIGSEYSKEVYNIFNCDVSNKKINELLYSKISDREFLKSTLVGILDDSAIRQEILISLLKKEFYINNKYINLEYKILDENSFMLILTDISDKKKLEEKIKEENQILKMIVELVTSLEQFIEIKSSYTSLILHIDDYKSINKLYELKREIHTYKGLFAQKEMLHIVKKLHDFEDHINASIEDGKLNSYMQDISFHEMNLWLQEDIDIIENILGDDFLNQANYIFIDKNRIGKLQAKISLYVENKELNDNEINDIQKDVEELQYTSVKTLFHPYEKLVEQLSIRLDKEVHPLVLNGKDIYMDNIYKSFINSLVHVFRNALDHGIDNVEKRFELGKDTSGTITCDVSLQDDNFLIKISDDGSGIDIEKIKDKAIKNKLFTKEILDKMTNLDVLMIIFSDDFSTCNNVTDISGRGIGLSSVLVELEKLNGEVDILNNLGEGLEFVFKLPKSKCINYDLDLLDKLSLRTISYFKEVLNIDIESKFSIQKVESLEINNISVTIDLTNDMNGTVYMGVSNSFALEIAKDYIDEEMSNEEIIELSCGNIAETLNITLGNILKDLAIMKSGGVVGISAPVIQNNKNLINKDNNSKILLSKLKYKKKEILLGYFI